MFLRQNLFPLIDKKFEKKLTFFDADQNNRNTIFFSKPKHKLNKNAYFNDFL